MSDKKELRRRNTKQRQMIYDAVMARCDHPSADDIYHDIHERDSRISKGTVYRNLNILTENGEITHVNAPNADRYDNRLDKHYHMRCTACDRVFDAPMEYVDTYDSCIAAKTGFIIERHMMMFEGICSECRKTKDEKYKN